MGILTRVNTFVAIYISTLSSLRKFRLWVPFLFYALLRLVLLLALVYFAYPPLAWFLIPAIKKFIGEYATHYPIFFLILSKTFSRSNLILSGLVGILISGAATFMFANFFAQKEFGFLAGLKTAFPKYFTLLGLWLVEACVVIGVLYFPPQFLGEMASVSTKRMLFLDFFSLGIGVLFSSVFAYTVAAVIIDDRNIFKAILDSFSIFRSYFFSTYFFVAIPALLNFPLSFINRKSSFLISKFNPEIIVLSIGLGVLISAFSTYLLVGTITRFYLWEKKESHV